MKHSRRTFPQLIDWALFATLGVVLLAFFWGLPASAQSTVTLGASVTSGDGSITTDVTWSTNPPLTTGTPCQASGHTAWAGAKAGSGTQTITIATSGTLNLALTCTFAGDSIVTYTWVNPPQNTDGSAYTNPGIVRLKHTFAASLTAGPNCAAGETCTDVAQTPAPTTVRTVTGITQTGTLRAIAYARNALNIFGAGSNVTTKVFTGSVPVSQSVAITVNPIPGAVTGLSGT
jgi:hypothetical protein